MGEYLQGTKIGKGNEKVFLVRGGWSCGAGYMVWTYVAKVKDKEPSYTKSPYDIAVSKIGERLFKPDNKLGRCHEQDLTNSCVKFIEDNNYFCDTIIVMRTD